MGSVIAVILTRYIGETSSASWLKTFHTCTASSPSRSILPRVSFRQQCMIFWNNHALLPKAYI
jgi:hypothetical protein